MFGFPTGIGCLIVKISALKEFKRPWFSGGTVEGVSILAGKHLLKSNRDAFHDGTIDFLALHAVERGLKWLNSIGMDVIHERVSALSTWLVREMLSLKHQESGRPLVKIAGIASGNKEVNYIVDLC